MARAAAPRTPARLSPGTIATRVPASARANACSPAAARILASRGASDRATPPVITITSGLRPFTIVPIVAPSARHASSTTSPATGSPSAAAAKTIAAHPFAQRQRIDVVVDEYRQAAAPRELRPHRLSGERGDVSDRLAHAPVPGVDWTGHADPDGGSAPPHALTHPLDQHRDRVERPAAIGTLRRGGRVGDDFTGFRDHAGGAGGASDVHAHDPHRARQWAPARGRRSGRA